jgi:putative CocE/NonD family hydrolase
VPSVQDTAAISGDSGQRLHRLPRHVRLLRRLSSRGLPAARCAVAVQRAIAVPAADGVTLLTDHYIPQLGEPSPTLLVRTPYGRGYPWNFLYGALFAEQGYHVVLQSCRGTGGSGGQFEPLRHEPADGQSAVAWLREQDWFTGQLGTIGTSYLGYVQWALAIDPPPELCAMVVQNGVHDERELLYPGGAFALQDAVTAAATTMAFQRGFSRLFPAMMRLQRHRRWLERTLPLTDAYPRATGGRIGFLDQWLAHHDAADPYWEGLRIPAAAAAPPVPVSLVTGWQDISLDQTLEQYARLRAAGREVRLLVGPWTHTSGFSSDLPMIAGDALGWLDRQLREPGGPALARVSAHVTGHGWQNWPDWPPPQARPRSWYLAGGGSLAALPPDRAGRARLHYDPAAPTPSAGGPMLGARPAGRARRDKLEGRADVLTFTTAPLRDPLEVTGPVAARLLVHSSNPHFDVYARLSDVDPADRSTGVCDGLLRHEPRGCGEPAGGGGCGDGEPGGCAMTVAMSSAAYRFAAGHRLRLQIAAGAHPRFARNTGTGEPPSTATALIPADIEILLGAQAPSALLLSVLADGEADGA